MAEILRRDKAASPEAAQLVLCARLVLLEPALRVGLKVQRKTLPHQQLVQAGGFAVDGAKPDMPFAVGFARPQILAMDTALIDQFGKLVARFHAARPGFGMFVDAHLVELRSIDAIEFESHAGELDGVSVLDERVLGASRTCCEKYQDHDQKTHRLNQPAKMMISPDLIAQQDLQNELEHRISGIRTVFDNLRGQATLISQVKSDAGLAACATFLCHGTKPLRCSFIVHAAAEPGNRQSLQRPRGVMPERFFCGGRRASPSLESACWKIIQGRARLWKVDDACDQAAIQNAYD